MDDVQVYKRLLDLPDDGADAQRVLEEAVRKDAGDDAVPAVKVLNMWMLHDNVSHELQKYVDVGSDTVHGVSLENERNLISISPVPGLDSMTKVLKTVSGRIDAGTCERAAGNDGDDRVRVIGLLGRLVTVKFVIVSANDSAVLRGILK